MASYLGAEASYPSDWKRVLEERGEPDPWQNPASKPEDLNQSSERLILWAKAVEAKIPYWLAGAGGVDWKERLWACRALWLKRRAMAIRVRAKIQDLPVSDAVRLAPLPPDYPVKRGPSHLTDWETPYHPKGSPPHKKQRCMLPGSPTYSDLTSTADVIYVADVPPPVMDHGPSPSPPASPSDPLFTVEGSNKENPIIID